ncbi:transporter [Aestuariivivens sediminis]|uniref:transporter n=1 Tax=Aestuariivivens sediminis TaxID=2913557 RepID=UPI001F5852DA|nr:transporter [Aestuariivivens sediminis]
MRPFQSTINLIFILLSTFIYAQYTDVINSNRPGVSRSAFSVGTNVLQFEVGPYIINEKRTPALRTKVDGFGVDFAARYGILWEELELNIEGTYQNDKKTYYSSIPFEEDRSNFKHVTLGAKYLIYDPYKNANDKPNLYSWKANHRFKWRSLIPAVSVYAGANYDTKNNPYTAADIEGFSPKVILATQNNFSGGWVFVVNLIKDRIGTDQSDFQYIFTLTHSFNPQWVIFGETQGIKSDFYADNLFRVGGAYLWSPNFQLDTAITFNSKDTPAVFSFNFGASYRFDFHEDKDQENIENGGSAMEVDRRSKRKRSKEGSDSIIEKQKRRSIDFD